METHAYGSSVPNPTVDSLSLSFSLPALVHSRGIPVHFVEKRHSHVPEKAKLEKFRHPHLERDPHHAPNHMHCPNCARPKSRRGFGPLVVVDDSWAPSWSASTQPDGTVAMYPTVKLKDSKFGRAKYVFAVEPREFPFLFEKLCHHRKQQRSGYQ